MPNTEEQGAAMRPSIEASAADYAMFARLRNLNPHEQATADAYLEFIDTFIRNGDRRYDRDKRVFGEAVTIDFVHGTRREEFPKTTLSDPVAPDYELQVTIRDWIRDQVRAAGYDCAWEVSLQAVRAAISAGYDIEDEDPLADDEDEDCYDSFNDELAGDQTIFVGVNVTSRS